MPNDFGITEVLAPSRKSQDGVLVVLGEGVPSVGRVSDGLLLGSLHQVVLCIDRNNAVCLIWKESRRVILVNYNRTTPNAIFVALKHNRLPRPGIHIRRKCKPPTFAIPRANGSWIIYNKVLDSRSFSGAQLTLKIHVPYLVSINEQAIWIVEPILWRRKMQTWVVVLIPQMPEHIRQGAPEVDVLEYRHR